MTYLLVILHPCTDTLDGSSSRNSDRPLPREQKIVTLTLAFKTTDLGLGFENVGIVLNISKV